jgi:hypothetical protein
MLWMRLARPGVKVLELLYASIIVGASLLRPSVSAAGSKGEERVVCVGGNRFSRADDGAA